MQFDNGEGAIAHTHSWGVVIIGTPSEVSTAHPPSPPTNTKESRTDTERAAIPKYTRNSNLMWYNVKCHYYGRLTEFAHGSA